MPLYMPRQWAQCSRDVNPNHFFADPDPPFLPDPTFHFDSDPDPIFYFDEDLDSGPEPASHRSDPPGLHFEPPSLCCERRAPALHVFIFELGSSRILTSIRIRNRLPKMIRIRIRNTAMQAAPIPALYMFVDVNASLAYFMTLGFTGAHLACLACIP
jgi:hypothetical protein